MTGFVNNALRDQVLSWLQGQVSGPRLRHCLRVEALAMKLAVRQGIDQIYAAPAGLMHDLALYFNPECLLAMAIDAGVSVDLVDKAHSHLLHAEVSALVARQEFGPSDRAGEAYSPQGGTHP